MGRILFLDRNRSDAPVVGAFGPIPGAVLSGGGWDASLPLTNLQDSELSVLARSVSAAPAHTRFAVAMTHEKPIFGFVLCNTNATISAQVRLLGYYDEARTELAVDVTFDAYPSLIFTEEAEWEDENSWDGKPLGEDLEGFTQNIFHVFRDPVTGAVTPVYARFWDVRILDETNPDGFFQAGRLFMAGGWAPTRNYVLGGALALETDTVVEKSMSGAEFFDVKEPYRVITVGFRYIPQQEALGQGLEMLRRAGIHGEIFVVSNPDDLLNLTRRSFMARPRRLAAWEQTAPNRADISFELKERLP